MESKIKKIKTLKSFAFEKHILSNLTYDEKVELFLNSFSTEERLTLLNVLIRDKYVKERERRIKSLTRGMK